MADLLLLAPVEQRGGHRTLRERLQRERRDELRGGGRQSRIDVRAAPPANRVPTANAGADQAVQEGARVQLAGSGSDSDGSVASYQWSQTAGPVLEAFLR